MAVISPDTFDPLNRYVGVRLQQGVPIVDADENEREDIRQFELRAYLRWFVGDGIPEGNDGFRIEISGASMINNFIIRAGMPVAPAGTGNLERGLSYVGRCLVDGLDVIIESDLNFTAQPLHNSQAGAAVLAAARGVPVIATVPNVAGTVTVYLDVWRRLLTPAERPSLVHPGLGTESCARFVREWVIRVRDGLNIPRPGDADFIPGHSYYALARITRRLGDQQILPTDVFDRRERRLMVPPATLISDTLGVNSSDYRVGIGRPAISLREAINSLLRGEMPSTPDTAISPSPGVDAIRRGFFFDQSNGVVAVWTSPRVGGVEQIFATRIDQNNIGAGFSPPVQVTTGAVVHSEPHTAVLTNGDIIVTYRAGAGAAADIMFKRAAFGLLGGAAEQTVVAAAAQQSLPSVVVSGTTAVFIFFDATAQRLQYRRHNLTTNAFIDAAPVTLTAPNPIFQDYHAATDNAGNVWIAARMGTDLRALRLNPATGAVDQEITIDSGGPDDQPFIMPISSTNILLFWHTPNDLRFMTNTGAAWSGNPGTVITGTTAADQQPVAVRDTDGGIWSLFSRTGATGRDIFLNRRNPLTGQWSDPRQITTSAGDDSAPFTIIAPNNALWLFWVSDRTADVDVYFKRLVTSV